MQNLNNKVMLCVCFLYIAHTRMAEVMNIIEEHSIYFTTALKHLISCLFTGQLGLIKEIYPSDGWGTEKAIRKKM